MVAVRLDPAIWEGVDQESRKARCAEHSFTLGEMACHGFGIGYLPPGVDRPIQCHNAPGDAGLNSIARDERTPLEGSPYRQSDIRIRVGNMTRYLHLDIVGNIVHATHA